MRFRQEADLSAKAGNRIDLLAEKNFVTCGMIKTRNGLRIPPDRLF